VPFFGRFVGFLSDVVRSGLAPEVIIAIVAKVLAAVCLLFLILWGLPKPWGLGSEFALAVLAVLFVVLLVFYTWNLRTHLAYLLLLFLGRGRD
jgi:prepilin signal peptidase PulO-like enzyme (type II secretory pathway)